MRRESFGNCASGRVPVVILVALVVSVVADVAKTTLLVLVQVSDNVPEVVQSPVMSALVTDVAPENFVRLPDAGEPVVVTVPVPPAVWQAPSAPRYCVPEQVENRATISAAAAGAIFVDVVNFGMFPDTGEPDDVTVPLPDAQLPAIHAPPEPTKQSPLIGDTPPKYPLLLTCKSWLMPPGCVSAAMAGKASIIAKIRLHSKFIGAVRVNG